MSEIQKFRDIAVHFEELVKSFADIVAETRDKINMALPILNEAVDQMKKMSVVLKNEPEKPLNKDENIDIQLALSKMASASQNMQEYATKSTEKSEILHKRTEQFKEYVQPLIKEGGGGGSLGFSGFENVAKAAVEGHWLGSAGVLLLSGMSFSPIMRSLIATGVVVGTAFSIIAKLTLMENLNRNSQSRTSIDFLNLILVNLDKFIQAILSLIAYTRNSKEKADVFTAHLETLKTSLSKKTPNDKRFKYEFWERAIQSAEGLIDCVNQLKQIDFKELFASSSQEASVSLTSN